MDGLPSTHLLEFQLKMKKQDEEEGEKRNQAEEEEEEVREGEWRRKEEKEGTPWFEQDVSRGPHPYVVRDDVRMRRLQLW